MTEKRTADPSLIHNIATGYMGTCVLLAALELNIFDEVSGKSFCSSDRNYDVIGNWAVVYMANMEWEAQLRYSYLTDKDIPCQVDSASARNLVVVSAGLFSETRLLVPLEYVLKAEELLQELEEQQ